MRYETNMKMKLNKNYQVKKKNKVHASQYVCLLATPLRNVTFAVIFP